MPKRHKKPGNKVKPYARGKTPSGARITQGIKKKDFVWRVDQIDLCGKWGWKEISTSYLLKKIIPKLHSYEGMSWACVEGTESHLVSVNDCVKEARKRLATINCQEDQLFSLRVTAKGRIWGIRDDAILRILWWDPNHEVCPSTLRHT